MEIMKDVACKRHRLVDMHQNLISFSLSLGLTKNNVLGNFYISSWDIMVTLIVSHTD